MSTFAPQIKTIPPKTLVGKRLTMSFAHNRTFELFSSFMPRRKEIENRLGEDIYCVQVYPSMQGFTDFKPELEFEKWAAVEVSSTHPIPDGMEILQMTGGLYAVFLHQGPATDLSTFEFIFKTWLPASNYLLDQREHFEILGAKYKNNSPESEEEIWIPVIRKP